MTLTLTDEQTSVITETDVRTSGDKAKSAHIVMVPPGEPDQTPQAYIMRAMVDGIPVTALCGHVWVPFRRAADLPVCQECKDIYEYDPNGFGDRGELPDE